MKRRTFLCSSAALAMSSTLMASPYKTLARTLACPLSALPDGTPYLDTMGLQLWTVRNELAMDPQSTLQAVADAGYHQVELGNVMDSDEIIKIARDLGMQVTSAFFNWETIANPENKDAPAMEAIIEKASEIDLKHLVFGYIGRGFRETADDFKKHADNSSVAGELCKAADIQLSYHNHSFEFKPLEDEVCGFEIFMERFHRDFVMFELDVFWAQIGGWDAIETLRKLDGRVAQVHLKDLKKNSAKQFDEGKVPEDAFQPLGAGSIDMAKVLAASKEVGVMQCHVEQDQSPDPIAAIATSQKHLGTLKMPGADEGKEGAEKKGADELKHEHDDHDHVEIDR